VRDALLGVEMVNGCGERLRFGGQDMKNVAGYDVSRLQAGAFGTLGLLLSVSLKVLPSPATQRSLVFEMSAADALARCRSWARQSLPITGTCFVDGLLRVRLSGAEAAVSEAMVQLGGALDADIGFWDTLRDHRLDFFADGGLWRCALPPAARAPLNDCLITWAGAERWWRTAGKADPAQAVIGQGGHARPFDAGYGVRIGPHLGGAGREYSARLKHAFDPGGILNPELSIMPQAAYAH
jgi:glycolate oxidase FAD binding subunit